MKLMEFGIQFVVFVKKIRFRIVNKTQFSGRYQFTTPTMTGHLNGSKPGNQHLSRCMASNDDGIERQANVGAVIDIMYRILMILASF